MLICTFSQNVTWALECVESLLNLKQQLQDDMALEDIERLTDEISLGREQLQHLLPQLTSEELQQWLTQTEHILAEEKEEEAFFKILLHYYKRG